MIEISVTNQQSTMPVDEPRMRLAAANVLAAAGWESASISLAVVDDSAIHALNREFLNHDWPTDVLSFLLSRDDRHLEGEVIVSAETALRSAAEYRWSAENEMLLYAVHGMLHLVGYDDQTPKDVAEMRSQEKGQLARLGIACRNETSSDEAEGSSRSAVRTTKGAATQ